MGVTLENPRELRGLEILGKGNQIRRIDSDTYRVISQSGNGSYLVLRQGSSWTCQCPDHQFRQLVCKHIYAVYFSQNLRQKVAFNNLGLLCETETSGCKKCGSDRIIKIGIRHNKAGDIQRFLCKECGHKFTRNEGFERMKATPKAITIALDLYFKGVSQRKILHHLKMFESIEVTQPTVLNWIRKYVELMKGYVDEYMPHVGGMWHTDEMTINIRKTEPSENGRFEWLWNLMDHETRFLIASQITRTREIDDARQVFQKAKATVGPAQEPSFVVTDKLQAYRRAFNKEFYVNEKNGPMHVRLKNIRQGTNNNIVERLHGTVRERTKVMRGLDNEESARRMIEGHRTYYNYLRPHMALNGKTPAEAAGLDMRLDGNKWETIIRRSAKHKRRCPH